jgi:hypothetical protein
MDQQNTSIPGPESQQVAGAKAHTANAHHKANRPWFKKKRFILLPALMFMIVIIWGARDRAERGISDTATSGPQVTASRAAQVKATEPSIGTKVRDGGFDFVVTGVEYPGKTLAGKVGETLTAQGEFVIVRANVTNTSTKEQTPSCSCQILMNDKGETFRPSSAILRTKEALKFVQLMKPGKMVDGFVLLFDVPTGTTVLNIDLHDSPGTPGVNVKLS